MSIDLAASKREKIHVAPEVAEILAIRWSLQLAKELKLNCLIIQSDALTAVDCINGIVEDAVLEPIAADCRFFLSSFSCASVMFIRRTDNVDAHNQFNKYIVDHVVKRKQYQIPNVKKWLGDVKHAMYEADQLLDEIATAAPLKKMRLESQPSTSNNFFSYVSAFINPFESRIKEMIKSLKHLAEQKDVLELKNGTCARNEVGVSLKLVERLPTSCLLGGSDIYGRDNDKDEMIKILLSNNGGGNRTPVSSIVGLGGMGKTTFAKLVYNESRIEEHFELKAWVYVSESFDVVGLTKAILQSFHSSADDEFKAIIKSFNSSLDDEHIFNLLQQRLQHVLTGKKYLLVLDDIWNKNAECWEQLLLPFNHGSSGSKIIVTTRDKEVANVLNSTNIFDLHQLQRRDCWSLFVAHAFLGKNACEYPNLESIGAKIVDKCGGLPLAVKTLGQLLRKNFSQHEWMKILETDMWRLSDRENNINPVLRLSYHKLPSNQKRCFAYCSIFPKGYSFDKGELIRCWMAEGLLKCYGTEKSEEEVGNEIFCDLESISFFQKPLFHYNTFVMHSLVKELANSISGEFCMQIEGARVEGILERTRHIRCSPQLNCVDKLLESVCKLKGLRSLTLKGNGAISINNNVQHDLFSKLKCLRMLSFRYCVISELVDTVSNLKLLRYLDLSYTKITSLPDTICMLYNLQTLLLRDCYELTELPSNFSKLINLRHLELPYYIKKLPKHIGSLRNLQALPYFIVEEKNGSDLKALEKLNHLHGTIHIKGLGNVIDLSDAATSLMKDKKYLEEIHMTFDDGREDMDGLIVEGNVSVLEALQPNSNLSRLIIENYNGIMFPNWIRGCHLPNLVSLKLKYCGLCSHFPPLGQLPSLKELSISNCHGIKIIGKEFYGNNSTNAPFKSLEVLRFETMNSWEEWHCLEGFPSLKELSIRDCPKLKRALPQHLPSLQILKIYNCKALDATILKIDNIIELDLQRFDRILVNELSSSLKKVVLSRNRYTMFSQAQNLFNSLILEELHLDFSGFVKCPSLNLHCYNSLCKLSMVGWRSSSLPFPLHLFINLDSLCLSDCLELKSLPIEGLPPNLTYLEIRNCPQLESFPIGGMSSKLRHLQLHNCPRLLALREEWCLLQLNSQG
ncbi:putative disease resistance RPP13-like protein 1 [Vicia villosa]|uniref:putative disease resistance RPP13-like protein 1 n=1 Tax=Vicia villosa TaxID=3911 RepID=UPI00273BAB2D|nr:putative disease resistance RPP13-like protein 1 [Vicia villosa]